MKPSVVVSLVLLVVSVGAKAAPITNGDFSQGLSGWNDLSFGGSANVGSEEALVLGGGAGTGSFAASVWQGDDGFFQFTNPLSLSGNEQYLAFDVLIAGLPEDPQESGASLFRDSISLELYDSLDFTYDLIFQSGSDFAVGNIWSTVFLDVSSLQGREFALTVNLFDEDDGFNTLFGLDNFEFTETTSQHDPVPVPEPASIGLFLVGLSALMLRRRAVKSQAVS